MRLDFLYLCLLLALALGLCACGSSPQHTPTAQFEEITVERLNIVSPDGTPQVVLSNQERFPPPVLGGDTLQGARSISPTGMVFYDASGNEAGGIAVVSAESGARRVALIFDYSNSEAIGLGTMDTQGSYSSSLTIADRVPLSANVMEVGTTGAERISIENENGTARITLNDGEERPRIRLSVAEDGEARIEVLGEDGEVTRSLLGQP
jgi:hypothetical protein